MPERLFKPVKEVDRLFRQPQTHEEFKPLFELPEAQRIGRFNAALFERILRVKLEDANHPPNIF